jgi:excisionase family DNA binding protein
MPARKATIPATSQRFFTITQVADAVSVSPRTVRRWIKSGALAVHSIEGIVRVSEVDFLAFLAVRREAGTMSPAVY